MKTEWIKHLIQQLTTLSKAIENYFTSGSFGVKFYPFLMHPCFRKSCAFLIFIIAMVSSFSGLFYLVAEHITILFSERSLTTFGGNAFNVCATSSRFFLYLCNRHHPHCSQQIAGHRLIAFAMLCDWLLTSCRYSAKQSWRIRHLQFRGKHYVFNRQFNADHRRLRSLPPFNAIF